MTNPWTKLAAIRGPITRSAAMSRGAILVTARLVSLWLIIATSSAQGPSAGPPMHRDQRGLSQSTENAILLAGAVTIAVAVVTAVGLYVNANLPR